MSFGRANLKGVVEESKTQDGKTTIVVKCPNINKTFVLFCEYFISARKNDLIAVRCEYMDAEKTKLKALTFPFIQIQCDRKYVIEAIIKGVKGGYALWNAIYSRIERHATLHGVHPVDLISEWAEAWHQTYDVNVLYKIDGVEPDNMKRLLAWWYNEQNVRRLYLFGINKTEINGAYMTCIEMYRKLQNNPYSVCSVPVDKGDAILTLLGREQNADNRYCGELQKFVWMYNNTYQYVGVPYKTLKFKFPQYEKFKQKLIDEYDLVFDDQISHACYIKHIFDTQEAAIKIIKDLVEKDEIKYDTPIDGILRLGASITKPLSEDQINAVNGALDHTFSVITGSAGTGKSTCIAEIARNLDLRGTRYAICSFTGKAVARIREIIGNKTAKTIHKLIHEFRKQTVKFLYNEDQWQPYEHIIIDEAGMLTTDLFVELISCYSGVSKITLVGDVNQLLPISWGCLFAQIIKSNTVPCYYLKTNYRVYTTHGDRDGIILNANDIINYTGAIKYQLSETTNFNFISGGLHQLYSIVEQLAELKKKYSDFESKIRQSFIVITPRNADIPEINRKVQEFFHCGELSHTDSRGVKWVVGDRVMATDNDDSIGVFNGEQGIIVDLDREKIRVDFGPSGIHDFEFEAKSYVKIKSSTQKFKKANKSIEMISEDEEIPVERTVLMLVQSDAITVDKSQGSEWDNVIFYMPYMNNKGSFINRNRIYTAITRARKTCWIVCDNSGVAEKELFEEAAMKSPPYRFEDLSSRLQKVLPLIEDHSTIDVDYIDW